MLRLFQDVMNGPEQPDLPQRADLTLGEGLVLAPLVIAMVLVGIDPAPLTGLQAPSTAAAGASHATVARVDR